MDVFPAQGLANGRLRLVRLLGEGGMGMVYEALDRTLRAPVAIKMMRSPSVEAVMRLKDEFRSLQEVRHPNLVRLGELFVDRETCFFTMELVDGVSFLDHVYASLARKKRADAKTVAGNARSPDGGDTDERMVWDADTLRLEVLFDEARLRAALRQLAGGLAALHRAGKVHRDVKPTNVLVTPEGRVVLLDLGLAVDVGDAVAPGTIEGTVEYMAPEQVGGSAAEPPADVYAMGAVLYEALTGRPPFLGKALQVLRDKQNIDPIAPSTMYGGVPGDLDELCLALLRRDPAARPTAQQVVDGLAESRRTWTPGGARADSAAPFVGRRLELAELHRALDDSVKKPVAVLVQGESGIGKSTLLRRFASEVRSRRALIFAGRCGAQESVPFRAFDGIADALSRYLLTLPDKERAPLLPADAADLTRLFRAFERLAPRDPDGDASGLDVRARRRRAFAVFRELLTNLARRQPIALVVDDLQWIDHDSVQLLEGLFSLRPPPLLLIGMMRPSREVRGQVKKALSPAGIDIRELALSGLTAEECTELARTLLPAPDDATLEKVARGCHGSPLFLEQIAAAVASGKSAGATLDQVLWERIDELDAVGRRALDLVCCAGAALDQRTIGRAAGVARQELAAAIVHLEQLRLVRSTGTRGSDLVEPYHDQVRQAVRALMTTERARRRHGALAEALERRRAPSWLTFHHWLAAGEAAKAAPHAIDAAMRAQRELAARRVAHLCQVALELLPEGHPARRDLSRALAVALANAGQGAEAARWYLHAAATGDGHDAIELRRRAAEHFVRCGRVDDGIAVFREVLAAVGVDMPATPGKALASLLWRRARMRWRMRRPPSAPGRTDASASLRTDVCMSIGVSLAMIDTILGASLHAQGALEAFHLGDRERIARVLATEAGYTATEGTRGAERTARLVAQADEAARESGSALASGMVLWVHSIAAFMQGRFEESVTAGDAAGRHFAEKCPGHVWEQTSAELFAAWALAHLGRLDEMARRLADLSQAARWNDDRYTATLCAIGSGVLPLLAADRPADARAQTDEAMASWSRAGFHLQHLMELLGRCESDLYEGDAAAAWRRLAATRSMVEGSLLLRMQHARITMLDMRARAALATGDASLRRVAADCARRILKEKAPWAVGYALARQAAVDRDVGGLERAAAAFDETGLALHAAAVRLRVAALAGTPLDTTDAWHDLQSRGCRRPDRWMAMYAPGFQ